MKSQKIKFQKYATYVSFFLLLLALITNISFAQKSEQDIRPLPINKTIERPLKGDESHTYKIKLKKGQVLRIDAIEKGINIQISVLQIADKQSLKTVDFGFGNEHEILTYIAEKTTFFYVQIKSSKSPQITSYELKAKVKETASNKDKEIIKAEQLFAEGLTNANKDTVQGLKEGIIKWEEVLPIWKKTGEKYWEGYTNNLLGLVHNLLGNKQKALNSYNQALFLFKTVGDKKGEAIILNNIGGVYDSLGEKQKALKFFNQALPLGRAIGNKSGEADTLNNIGSVYNSLGQKQKALEYYNQALPLRKTVGDKNGEAIELNNIGTVYSSLGEKQKALKFFNQALPLYRTVGDKSGEADTLNNIGSIYNLLGNKQKALEYYNQALPLKKTIGDKGGEAITLNNIGSIYSSLGEKQKALKYYNLALPLSTAIGDRIGEAAILNNIGKIYSSLGEKQKALENHNQALLLSRILGDSGGEATTLYNMMVAWESLRNSRLAIFYGKQSIKNYQQLRVSSQGLDIATQKSFLRRIKITYQRLANLLIEEGHLAQVVQILNLYQDQQFFDFDKDSNSPIQQISLSLREQLFADLYESSSDKVGKLGFQPEELKRQIGQRQATEEEKIKLKTLEVEFKSATDSFLKVLKDAEIEFSQKPDYKDKVPTIKDVSEMQSALQELSSSTKQKTAALYTLIGEKKFYLLLMTGEGSVKVFSSAIEAGVLNKKLIQFYALLQTPAYDSRILGKELYDIIIPEELEKELKKQKVKTLMWSLDGNLRYIPMSALSPDGKKYLVEKYQNVLFTRADKERMTKAVSPNWTGVGFGSSNAHKVDLLGDKNPISFKALSGVKEELKTIFQTDEKDSGVLNGEVLEDEKFTKESFFQALKKKREVMHISSHFRFYPGDSSLSFLLLGDGTPLTLNELKKQERLFEGVELLTLSACETGAVLPNSDGREIDGFAELAQRLGANAVMATLWQVKDQSTAELMKEFYRNSQKRKLNKAEALRKAQLKLLKGKSEIKPKPTEHLAMRSDGKAFSIKDIVLEKNYRVPFKKKRNKPFAHPYYWSPFVLYGNWQ